MRQQMAVLGVALVAVSGLAVSGCSGNQDHTSNTTETPTSTTSTPPAPPVASPGPPPLVVGALPERLAPIRDAFTQHTRVWGVDIVATASTDPTKIRHAAHVLAQYVDNDADGTPDDQAVVAALADNKATLLMAATPDEMETVGTDAVMDFVGAGGQDLYGSETAPAEGFDASLEEVHHLLLNNGWADVHANRLAQKKGSPLAEAMDAARGGHFDSVPRQYPADAWYTYDDDTCDYTCMITEYTYWAHTSLLGAQRDRATEIADEWRLATPADVRARDSTVTAILTDPSLGLPTVLPDGKYTARLTPGAATATSGR